MAKRALVLGGGGVIGVAWETGMVKGLLDGGVDVAGADLTVGTSAGSIVGAQIGFGRSPDELLAAQLAPTERPVEQDMQSDLSALTQLFGKWTGAREMTQALRAEIGAMALAARTTTEERLVASFEGMVGAGEWPERPLLITAVDAEDGAFAVWDRDSGVRIERAVAASCAVPGLFPPVTIDGRRYMDGGVRSGTSADLAKGHRVVVVVAPIGASEEGLGRIARRQLDAEVRALRAEGRTVEVVLPDSAALEAFGPNLMDTARRASAAEAGERQGKGLARRLGAVWHGAAA